MNSSDLQRILHIITYCEDIAKTIQRFGEKQEIFFGDLDYRNSISMSIMQIGELSVGLTEEFKTATKGQMQWGLIRGMRNMFAHTYLKMDKTVIWDVATKDIPGLLQFCHRALELSKSSEPSLAEQLVEGKRLAAENNSRSGSTTRTDLER
jgi:uncharacterized protein with HEPN domain